MCISGGGERSVWICEGRKVTRQRVVVDDAGVVMFALPPETTAFAGGWGDACKRVLAKQNNKFGFRYMCNQHMYEALPLKQVEREARRFRRRIEICVIYGFCW